MSPVLRIGSRASRLALVQTSWVAQGLRAIHPGLDIRIEEFRTEGDRDRATPLAHLGGTGFFVKELEVALLDRRIDLAVHSMKDVPSRPAAGLQVEAAVPERADPRDCLVTTQGLTLAEMPKGALVGSSSPRRRAMLLAARPDLAFADLRGNVETRLKKLEAGVCQATILARAGLGRLGVFDRRMVPLDPSILLPAAGQGALGLEFRDADEAVRGLILPLDHAASRAAVVAERALCRRLQAGCSTPLGALGRVAPDGALTLEACLVSADGRQMMRRRASGPAAEADDIGTRLADAMLADGAARLLMPTDEAPAEDGAGGE
jgi:hydroxymethylbilane synthase